MRPSAKIDLAPALLLLIIIIQISRVVPRVGLSPGQFPYTTQNRRHHQEPVDDSYSLQSTPHINNGISSPTSEPKTIATALSSVMPYQKPSADENCSDSLFSAPQRRFCQAHPTETWLMGKGAEAALRECLRAFKDMRWNCSLVKKGPAGLTHSLVSGSREASFVHAIAAGAMTHALVRGCADGSLRNCRCDRELHGRALPDFPMWKWGGCSADLRHPIRLNRRFMETGSGSKVIGKVRAQDHIDRHNNMAGRLAVKYTRRTICRCHGTSGACNLKTCWKTLAPVYAIGDYLTKRYRQALQVEQPQVQDGQLLLRSATDGTGIRDRYNSVERNQAVVEVPRHHRKRQSRYNGKQRVSSIKPKELIFTSDLTDYCRYDPNNGSRGTGGRKCTKENSEYLCCGRGYTEEWRIEGVHCRCRFEWCCQVHCEICHNRTLVRTCEDSRCIP
ncbi:protein Wnt-7b-like [Varroa destructor]|uniref:Protein Wnt n=1 Tax=Varroa destructor TaxID=109461 RepID=A0A7M7JJG4_VARDE|nr:protein Wnt-7b-like [Varroa destructor]